MNYPRILYLSMHAKTAALSDALSDQQHPQNLRPVRRMGASMAAQMLMQLQHQR
jgi:hypothetical protein